MNADDLVKQLRNIGPKLAERMIKAGIDSPKKLRELGAQQAYIALYRNGDAYGDHNAAYLYALEGAIRDCDWREIPESKKSEFRQFTQSLQQASRQND